MAPKSSKRQFLIRVAGIDGYFATKTGGQKTATTTKVFDGGARIPDILTGNQDVSDVTIGRPFDRTRDMPLVKQLLPLVGVWDTSLFETPTDENLVPSGDPLSYSARLREIHVPDADAGSGDNAPLELVFAIRELA